jgi:type VI secretion system protein ImpJ
MRTLSRVVWSEGMHLAQHHFQAQNAYFEAVAGEALASLFHGPYGLIACEMDVEALLNGTAAVVAARGIMPDGMPFAFPEEPPPAPLRIADLFSPTQSSHLLLLGLPEAAPGRANTAMNGDDDAAARLRFSVEQRAMPDETTGADERPVPMARKNFRLLLDTEPTGGLVTLPIARVQRGGDGQFVYDAAFVGPTLRLAGSARLRELTARLIEMLESRADTVRAERSAGGAGAEYAPREIAGFWFLHALNTAIPPLRHALRTGAAHPEQLYLQLARLAGALCTFSLRSSPRDLPAYDHDAPEPCFAALEQHIRQHLDVILPSDAISLVLQPADVGDDGALHVPAAGQTSFFAATVPDARCFEPSAQWFLGLRSTAPGADVTGRAASLVKLCSSRYIGKLVERAYPGLGLEHVPVPPAAISPRAGMHYFLVTRTDPCWKWIVEGGEVGLYLPGAIRDPEMELKVVLEGRG